ncbi:MAG: Fe-S cluster assembly transcriptional regulator IscR [Gammaproteobacteria bacterium]|nr:Fe-S cluster assembly transcriptional regulator IscR [Gammaproteobacteria bacterium]
MRLSTKGRYAVTAMMDLAIHDKVGPVTLADISQCQGISLSYLEQLFAKLRKHGLVEGVRGPGGGYRLARPADQVTVAEIIEAVDEKMDATRCNGKENCQEGERCLTHDLWAELSQQIYDFLNGITLAQFAERPSVQEVVQRQDTRHGRPLHRYSAA